MIGYWHRKYHAAILGGDNANIVNMLKEWYDDAIVIKTYNDSTSFFDAINLNKLENHPFDIAVVDEKKNAAVKLVLKQTDPELRIVSYSQT